MPRIPSRKHIRYLRMRPIWDAEAKERLAQQNRRAIIRLAAAFKAKWRIHRNLTNYNQKRFIMDRIKWISNAIQAKLRKPHGRPQLNFQNLVN